MSWGTGQNFRAPDCGLSLIFLGKNVREVEPMERSHGRKTSFRIAQTWVSPTLLPYQLCDRTVHSPSLSLRVLTVELITPVWKSCCRGKIKNHLDTCSVLNK